MADVYLLGIDLSALRGNLSDTECREVTEAEVRDMLAEAGFVATPDGRVAEDVSLGFLCELEIMSKRLIA